MKNTAFDSKVKHSRDSKILLIGIFISYTVLVTFNPMSVVFFLILLLTRREAPTEGVLLISGLIAFFSLAGFFIAFRRFSAGRAKTLDDILGEMGALPVDPKDRLHKVFADIVGEISGPRGLGKVRPVVIPTWGCNAFSAEDRWGRKTVGVTEGLLAHLDREEIAAVVAHEVAHLECRDSYFSTLVCSVNLSGLFDQLDDMTQGRKIPKEDYKWLLWHPFVLWIWLSDNLTRWISSGNHRKRERVADAMAVQITKDPLALAQALYKISERYRGKFEIPSRYSTLFILSPKGPSLEEGEGWVVERFSTHPPLRERLKNLTTWAQTNLTQVKRTVRSLRRKVPAKKAQASGSYFLHVQGDWKGPFSPAQLLSYAAFGPMAWISPVLGGEVLRVFEVNALHRLFLAKGSGAFSCPRCQVPLRRSRYEGAPVQGCDFCDGRFLEEEVFRRILNREVADFDGTSKKAAFALFKVGSPRPSLDHFPAVACPRCRVPMEKSYYWDRLPLDRCPRPDCKAVWCDGGELETLEIVMEQMRKEVFGEAPALLGVRG